MATKEELAVIINEVLDDNPGLGSDELAERISQRAGLGLGYNNKFVDIIRAYKNSRSGLELVCESALELSGAKTTALNGDAEVKEYKIPIELTHKERPPFKYDNSASSGISDPARARVTTTVNATLRGACTTFDRVLFFEWGDDVEDSTKASNLRVLFESVISDIGQYIDRQHTPDVHFGFWPASYPPDAYRSTGIYYTRSSFTSAFAAAIDVDISRHARFLLCELVKRARNELGIELVIAFNP